MLWHLGLFSFLTCFARRNRELELKHGRICAWDQQSRCLEVDGCDTVEMHNIIEIVLEIYRYYGWYIICDTVEILLKG